MKKLLLTIAVIAVFSVFIIPFLAKKKSPEKQSTNVTIENISNEDSVQVFITLQSTDSVIGMFGITDTSVSFNKGSFWAYKGQVYSLGRTTAIQGAIVSFGGDNQSCSSATANGFPWGINNFEFSVNIPYESANISCEDGCNSIIRYSVTDTVNWTTGLGDYTENFRMTQNVFPLINNIGVKGVFPYRCTDCIQDPNPLQNCFNLPDSCDTKRQCQIDRTNNNGGTIECKYLGKAFEIAE